MGSDGGRAWDLCVCVCVHAACAKSMHTLCTCSFLRRHFPPCRIVNWPVFPFSFTIRWPASCCTRLREPCSLGAHAAVIVPPWIIKVKKPQVTARTLVLLGKLREKGTAASCFSPLNRLWVPNLCSLPPHPGPCLASPVHPVSPYLYCCWALSWNQPLLPKEIRVSQQELLAPIQMLICILSPEALCPKEFLKALWGGACSWFFCDSLLLQPLGNPREWLWGRTVVQASVLGCDSYHFQLRGLWVMTFPSTQRPA